MSMQTDVKQARLTQTGWIVQVPCRVKGVSLRSNGSAAGRVFLFDTDTTPVTASYGQSTTTVTVTKTAHGLSTGDTVSIGYVPDACYYVTGTNRWIYVKGVGAADQYINYELIPGEGLRASQKVYVLVLGGMQSAIVYYG